MTTDQLLRHRRLALADEIKRVRPRWLDPINSHEMYLAAEVRNLGEDLCDLQTRLRGAGGAVMGNIWPDGRRPE